MAAAVSGSTRKWFSAVINPLKRPLTMAPEVKGLGGDKGLGPSRDLSHTVIAGLKERVLAAAGADREIDADLFALFVETDDAGYHQWLGDLDQRARFDRRYYDLVAAKDFTASIDAAVSLVEWVRPGWSWQVTRRIEPSYRADVANMIGMWECEEAATPALALLAALLTALDEDSGVDER
jgi:hypothetical protein